MTFGSPALAQRAKMPPEHVISYQASLTDLDGKPIANGVYEIFASLYSDPEGLSLVWRSNYRVEAKAGIINLTLGEVLDGGVPLPDSGLDGPLYLGIRIMGDPITGATASEELRPLTRLSASLNALSVADNSVTKSKLAADYVEHIVINGDTISGKASTLDLRAGSGILMTKDGADRVVISSVYTPPSSANGTGGGTVNTTNTCGTNHDGFRGTNQVSGGCDNTIYHYLNYIPFDFCTIGGGEHNRITNETDLELNGESEGTWWHTIGGGHNNTIIAEIISGNPNQNKVMGATTIGGGDSNLNISPWGTIGGGRKNLIAKALPTVDDEQGVYLRYNVISGGDSNRILRYSLGSVIGGGSTNVIDGSNSNDPANYATISGGDTNKVHERGGAIGGGRRNIVSSKYGAIAGGVDGKIGLNSSYSAIAGGNANLVSGEAEYASIGGGYSNAIDTSWYATVSGGRKNRILPESDYSAIGGGFSNSIKGTEGAIGGGDSNKIGSTYSQPRYAVIGGGKRNEVWDDTATIAGGAKNLLSGSHGGAIGGGTNNRITGNDYGTIAGGADNLISGADLGKFSVIGGGEHNQISSDNSHNGIVGGEDNHVRGGQWNVIAGGQRNTIERAEHAFIGSGVDNWIWERRTFIGGGYNNISAANVVDGVIGGGNGNMLSSALNGIDTTVGQTVSGGEGNSATTFSYTTVGGGFDNKSNALYSTVGGGFRNSATAEASAIPGGDNLTATNYAQTVLGRHNVHRGFSTRSFINPDDPILTVGNGTSFANRSQAFEVTNSGHSIVYHNNGPAAPMHVGGTYRDNVILAWGHYRSILQNFDLEVGAAPGGPRQSFGVTIVAQAPGVVTFRLHRIIVAGPIPNLKGASVTATIVDDDPDGCPAAFITTSPINANGEFIVRTFSAGGDPCAPDPRSFDFIVTGRTQ